MSIKSLPETLRPAVREPVWWAAAASLGLHGLIFGIAPLLPATSQETEAAIQRPVSLVELTPEELSRVPEFELPRTTLPPLLPAPSSHSLPNGPGSFSLSPIPDPLANIPVPPLLPLTPLPPPPPGSSFPGFPSFPIFGNRSFTPPPAPPAAVVRRPVAPPPATPQPSASATPASPSLALNKPDRAVAKPSPGATPEATPDADTASATPTPDTSAATPTPAATPAPPPVPRTPTTREEILASIPQGQRSLYFPNPEGTQQSAVVSAMSRWVSRAGDWLRPIPEGKKEDDLIQNITLNRESPGLACNLGLKGTAFVGVMVSPDGGVAADPTLIQSAGYGILNDEALAIASGYGFDAAGFKRIYQIKINFDPAENCPAIEPSSSSG